MTEAPHTVKSYEEELKNLNSNIIKMGGFCEEALGKAIQAITTRNSDNAESVIQEDEKIDKIETMIEQQVVNLIALRQPMAIDLRETVTALKISSDLERIGDLAKNISKRTLLLNENLPKNLVDALIRVSTNVQKQLKAVLDAYLERSSAVAIKVWESDEQIDDLTNLCMNEVISYLKDNEKNLVDIPKKVIDDIKITPVNTADDVLKIALTKELKPTDWVEVDKISENKKSEKTQASIQ